MKKRTAKKVTDLMNPDPSQQSTGQATKTLERIRPELNLEKWSVWQPSKSQNALRTKVLEREIVLPDGSRVNATVKIAPTTEGALTTEDQKTYYALVRYWEESNRSDAVTFFSMRRLAKLLKKRWGTDVINSLTQSLTRLRGTLFTWENSYFDNSTKETIELLDTFNIISDLKLVRRKKEGAVNKAVGYFRFNDFVLGNLKTNHTKPLLFDVVMNFKSEIAQLLYVYLDLIMNDKTLYERRTKELFDDLGLEGTSYKNPSNRKQKLVKALEELQGVPLTTGSIAAIALEKTKDGKDFKLVVRKGSRSAVALAEAESEISQVNASTQIASDQPESEDALKKQAKELVKYFYQVFFGVEKIHVNSKAADQAISLIAHHGMEQARYVVDFAKRVAPETGYEPQTFGGIMQYESRAIAEFEEQEQRIQRRAKVEAEEAERYRLEEQYEKHRTEKVDGYIAAHPEEFQTQLEARKQELMNERPELYRPWGEELFTEFTTRVVRSALADQIGIESFTEYYERMKNKGENSPES